MGAEGDANGDRIGAYGQKRMEWLEVIDKRKSWHNVLIVKAGIILLLSKFLIIIFVMEGDNMYIVKRVLLVVFILTLSISPASVCCAVNKDEARKADMIANPDRYTEHISTGSGIGLYMDNASISVERYDPPHYIIRFDVFCVSHPPTGGCNVYEATSERIYFDWDNKKAYRYEKDRETGVEGWKEISRNNYLWKFTRFANAAFRAAYNMDFFSQNQIW